MDRHEVRTARQNDEICGTGRCTPPKQKHGHEQDATQLASIPRKVAPKHRLTACVWCVRKCATKRSNRSFRQHLRWKLYESCAVLRVRNTLFELKTLS